MKKLRVAVIGQGRSGRNIHGAYFKSERNTNYEVAYVVEMDEFRRNRALNEYPGCKVFADYKDLLDKTGGIIQGMSGSPIIQNGRIVGAVTHVLVDEPEKGYGIFAETMLEKLNSLA